MLARNQTIFGRSRVWVLPIYLTSIVVSAFALANKHRLAYETYKTLLLPPRKGHLSVVVRQGYIIQALCAKPASPTRQRTPLPSSP